MNLSLIEIVNLVLSSLQVLLIVIATIYGLSQLRENTRVRQADVIDRVFDYVSSPEIREPRKRLSKMKIPSNLSKLVTAQPSNETKGGK